MSLNSDVKNMREKWKELKKQIRLVISESLLEWAMRFSPDASDEKSEIAIFVIEYMKRRILCQKKEY